MRKSLNISNDTTLSVFKSETGRRIILNYYTKLLETYHFSYRERYVNTSYGSTYVLESGSEDLPALFLFHGSSSNSAMWFADLGELAGYFHVFAVDTIGDAGHSAQTRPDTLSDDYALWIRDLFDVLGIQKAAIMGNSLGGWLCLKFAAAFPERTEKIVLLASAGIRPVKKWFTVKMLFYLLQGEKGKDPLISKLPALSNAELAGLTMPVFYIAGEDDPTVNTRKSAKRLQKIVAKPTVCLLKNNGHIVYHVLDKVIPFLRSE